MYSIVLFYICKLYKNLKNQLHLKIYCLLYCTCTFLTICKRKYCFVWLKELEILKTDLRKHYIHYFTFCVGKINIILLWYSPSDTNINIIHFNRKHLALMTIVCWGHNPLWKPFHGRHLYSYNAKIALTDHISYHQHG